MRRVGAAGEGSDRLGDQPFHRPATAVAEKLLIVMHLQRDDEITAFLVLDQIDRQIVVPGVVAQFAIEIARPKDHFGQYRPVAMMLVAEKERRSQRLHHIIGDPLHRHRPKQVSAYHFRRF
jgi:hypothetical protein